MFSGSKHSFKCNASFNDGDSSRFQANRIYRIVIKAFIVAVILTVLGFVCRGAWHLLYVQNPRLTLKYIDFKETHHYTAYPTHGHENMQAILKQIGIALNQTNLLAIDLDKVQNLLFTDHPLLHEVKVSKVLPDTLKIEATENTPVAFFVAKNAQGGIMQFPIAIHDYQTVPMEMYSVVLLPSRLELFNEVKNTVEPWNYALFPIPFDKNTVNSTMPMLFGFNATLSANNSVLEERRLTQKYSSKYGCCPGQILEDKQLSSAIKLIKLLGVTSGNRQFVVQQISYVAPNTLRVLVDPMPDNKKIQTSAQFDFECNAISESQVAKLLAFLANCEHDPKCTQIRYLNVSDTLIYSSPEQRKITVTQKTKRDAKAGSKNQKKR